MDVPREAGYQPRRWARTYISTLASELGMVESVSPG